MAPTALVGFHSAYSIEEGNLTVSGPANALVGAYVGRLGLSDEAIIFFTQAGPRDLSWLNISAARKIGLRVHQLSADYQLQTSFDQQDEDEVPLQLPQGYRWIVLVSSKKSEALPTNEMAIPLADDWEAPHPPHLGSDHRVRLLRMAQAEGYSCLTANNPRIPFSGRSSERPFCLPDAEMKPACNLNVITTLSAYRLYRASRASTL